MYQKRYCIDEQSLFRYQKWQSELHYIPGIEKVKPLDQYTESQRKLFATRERFLARGHWLREPDPQYGEILFSAKDYEDFLLKMTEPGY